MLNKTQKDTGRENRTSKDYYDLTEEASKRPGSEEATVAARQAESDDIHEETTQGPVDRPEGDNWGENKVAVSDDD